MVDLNQATPVDRPARRRAGVKFIHAADLHIDSPLRGLESYDGAPLEQLRGATRSAMQNLVHFALREAVDFVIIAGDLFDGKWQDVRTGLWTAARLRELDRAGIRVLLLQGNHDAASKVRQAIQWPGNTHVFAVDRPETIRWDDLRVALHGQGFAQEQVTDDLAAGYPEPVAGYFNIGVLHSSLTGNPLHDSYAPTSLATLVARGYDYWALGHIHARSEPALCTDPYIAYCGNLQGRHIRETGAKGCLLAQVEDGQLQSVAFQALDTLRWSRVEVTLESHHTRTELLDEVRHHLLAARGGAEGRLLAVRVIVQGAARRTANWCGKANNTSWWPRSAIWPVSWPRTFGSKRWCWIPGHRWIWMRCGRAATCSPNCCFRCNSCVRTRPCPICCSVTCSRCRTKRHWSCMKPAWCWTMLSSWCTGSSRRKHCWSHA